jgi:hypothetical protein
MVSIKIMFIPSLINVCPLVRGLFVAGNGQKRANAMSLSFL